MANLALLNEAQTSTADHTIVLSTFDNEPPPAGPTPMRFIGYVELGKRPASFEGKEKPPQLQATLFFELNGKKHVRTDENGKTFTNRIKITLPVSTGDRANFKKLFNAMRAGRAEITNMAQMLNEPFLGTVVHNTRGEGQDKRTYANLRDDSGWKIGPPVFIDPLDPDNIRKIDVAEATQDLMLLLWDNPSKAQWDSIYIEGERTVKDADGNEVTKSKNYIQNDILENAVDLQTSPLLDVIGGLDSLAEPVKKADKKADKPAAKTPEIPGRNGKPVDKKPDTGKTVVTGDVAIAGTEASAKALQEAKASTDADDILASLGM